MSEKLDPKFKYQHHDLHLSDLTDHDIRNIKGNGVRLFTNEKEADPTKVTINSFMRYLTSNGYRIVKDDQKE